MRNTENEKIDIHKGLTELIASQKEGYPSGVAGALARNFTANARYSDVEFSIAAMLGVASSIASRSYHFDQDTSCNLYMAVLGDSGAGKDDITKNISRTLEAIDKNNRTNFLGRMCQTMPASKEGVTTALADRGIGSVTFMKSEIDKYLAKAQANETSKQKEIIDELLELYSQSSASYIKRAPARADKGNIAPDICAPCVTLVGEGTREIMYDSLSQDSLTGGFVSRLLLIERKEKGRKIQSSTMSMSKAVENLKYCEAVGTATEIAKARKAFDEFKGRDENGRLPIPVKVLESLSRLGDEAEALCCYTRNQPPHSDYYDITGTSEDVQDPKGSQEVITRPTTSAPNTRSVIFSPDAKDFIDKMDDGIDAQLTLEGTTRGAAWTRVTLKSKKVASLLAILENPTLPIITLEQMEWAFKWVDGQAKILSRSVDNGEIGGGSLAKQSKALKEALVRTIDQKETTSINSWKRQTGKALLIQGVLSESMIKAVARANYAFSAIEGLSRRKDAVEGAVLALCDEGFIQSVKADTHGLPKGIYYLVKPDVLPHGLPA
ncbi:hypothetical protein [Rubritalea profundi]|uniref:DUF3987 domain-containing protein n=1 Tax=Rubritalea profundi TaxID=1658618 RepID=A0A2S7U169_9BACT|nr:hypothetical protein [Rubritalea profundi]PQJ27923.1 hypothetical protein BSZ32_05015 [Rubritalea profundi]